MEDMENFITPNEGRPVMTKIWLLCDLCHGVAYDPDPEGWGEPCDNCAGHGGRWIEQLASSQQRRSPKIP